MGAMELLLVEVDKIVGNLAQIARSLEDLNGQLEDLNGTVERRLLGPATCEASDHRLGVRKPEGPAVGGIR